MAPMADDRDINATFAEEEDSLYTQSKSVQQRLSLVILWSRSEPERVGELVQILPRRSGDWILGRPTEAEAGAEPDRLSFLRQRPGANEPTGELTARRLSREHLRIRLSGSTLDVRNGGKLPLLVNNTRIQRARVSAGDVVELAREVLLLCEYRPEVLPGVCDSAHGFGQADADGIVGETPATWALRQQISFCGSTAGHVIIRGPSGAGKELVAQALHRQSGPGRVMVSRNASTFPEGILDAELFGNLRNYPNPGMPARPGAIGEADGGTLFLDEIGEVSHSMQAHLLRVLDSGEYQRLGDATARTARFRLIGATNRPLDSLKHDFLARFLRRIELAGLESRRADIPLLVRHLLGLFAADDPTLFPDGIPRQHPRLITRLVVHSYASHTREIAQLLWKAIEHWQEKKGKYLDLESDPVAVAPPRRASSAEEISREDILAAYRRFGGVQARVPEHLGLGDRFQLNRLEKKLGITRADREAAVQEAG
jgi:transcriptional regulator with AAA-type ATPase domain